MEKKKSGCAPVVWIIVLSIILATIRWYLGLALLVAGFGYLYSKHKNDPVPEDTPHKLSAAKRKTMLSFPETDALGMPRLQLLDRVHLTGVTREWEGKNPQDTIEHLSIGDMVQFQRPKLDKYPYAVLVTDLADNPIGWIPEAFVYQPDIAKRLDDGTTVLGRVNEIVGGDNGKNYGCFIDIARYEKKRVTKSKQKLIGESDGNTNLE